MNSDKKKIDISIIIASVIFVISISFFVVRAVDHQKAEILNNSLAEKHNAIIGTTIIASKEEDEPTGGTEQIIIPTEINMAADTFNKIEESTSDVLREELRRSNEMNLFYKENNDTAGWIKVDGTKVDNIVMQTTDNDFYLHHNFYKEESQPGTVFVDYRCNVNTYNDLQSDNIILYGHKQRDNTMFGSLHYYKGDLDFYKEHPTIEFSNLYETYTYKIIAMFVAETNQSTTKEEIFDYQNYINFNDEYSFGKFMAGIKKRTQINTSVNVKSTDKFLTLSTCSYEVKDARFVIVARRVRDGESTDVDVTKATFNKSAQYK